MKTVKYYCVEIPMGDKPATEKTGEYRILKENKHNRLVIDNEVFTVMKVKKDRWSGSDIVLNQPSVWKWTYSKPDVWHASCYYQGSEKIMRRKILGMLKRKIAKEYYWNSEALVKLEKLICK